MLGKEDRQGDFFDSHVYGRLVPPDHILVRIKQEVDMGFVEEEVKDCYCTGVGRPSIPPGVLFRTLFLQHYFSLSDRKIVDQMGYNLLFRYFAGLKIEDEAPDDTTLCVFRQRLGEERFERMFDQLIKLAQKRGLIEGSLKITDATELVADIAIPNTINLLRQGRKVALRQISRSHSREGKLLKAKYDREKKYFGKPKAEDLAEEVELTKEFLRETKTKFGPQVEKVLQQLEKVIQPEVLASSKPGRPKKEEPGSGPDHRGPGSDRIKSFVDPEARAGYKRKDKPFVGYKAHIAMDEGSQLVTSVEVLTGEKNEGAELKSLLDKDKRKGIVHQSATADALYDSADNRQLLHDQGMRAYIPSRRKKKHLDGFHYDEERDQVVCPQGCVSQSKTSQERGYLHIFSVADCKDCPRKEDCPPKLNSERARVFVSEDYRLSLADHYPERKEALAKRPAIERKFGEAKKWHGMGRARYRGRARVAIQVLMTFFVINAKRMVRLLEAKTIREPQLIRVG